jgi:hypothetical protein
MTGTAHNAREHHDSGITVKEPLGRGACGLNVQPRGDLPGVAYLLTVTRQRTPAVHHVLAGIALSTDERDQLIRALGGTP